MASEMQKFTIKYNRLNSFCTKNRQFAIRADCRKNSGKRRCQGASERLDSIHLCRLLPDTGLTQIKKLRQSFL